MAAGHRSVREARGLGNYLAVAASNVVGVLRSGPPSSTGSLWPLPRDHRDPSKGHSDLDLSNLVSCEEEGRRVPPGPVSDFTLHSCARLH